MTPKAVGITESALYVDDLARAVKFYQDLLGSPVIHRDERFGVLRVAPEQILLLFVRGSTPEAVDLPFGRIISHDGSGPHHICFGVGEKEMGVWEQRLGELGIAIESRVDWPGGCISLYFRDPDGHAVELATPGLWVHCDEITAAIPAH